MADANASGTRPSGIGRELQRERRIDAERPRQRVAERERAGAEGRAPRDPAQLPACRQRRDLAGSRTSTTSAAAAQRNR